MSLKKKIKIRIIKTYLYTYDTLKLSLILVAYDCVVIFTVISRKCNK